jgi:hypothetical protein
MGPVERAVRSTLAAGEELVTPAQGAPFVVERMDDAGIVLLLGRGRWPARLTWECIEGIAPYLAGRGWAPIGTTFETEGQAGTLDAYLKGCTKTATAGWVAAVLERAGVVEIDRSRPASVRLRT